MAQPNPTPRSSLTDLFSRYLQQQVDAHAHGLGFAEPASEAVPH